MGRKKREPGAGEFGKRLRELRKSRGWSQEYLAKQLAIDRTMVGGYERGLHSPPLATLIKLSRLLQISVDRLLGVEENKVEDLQDRRLYQLFLRADQADLAKQGLVKQVLESILSAESKK